LPLSIVALSWSRSSLLPVEGRTVIGKTNLDFAPKRQEAVCFSSDRFSFSKSISKNEDHGDLVATFIFGANSHQQYHRYLSLIKLVLP
jgi:hypothetical protein